MDFNVDDLNQHIRELIAEMFADGHIEADEFGYYAGCYEG